jgi:hypothetical protein
MNQAKNIYKMKEGVYALSFLLLASWILLFSCAKREKPVDYFPLKDGAMYIYNHGQSRRVVEFFRKEKNYDLYKINNFVNDSIFVMVDYFIKTDSIVYWYGFRSLEFGLVYFEPPIPWIPSVQKNDSILSVTTTEIRKVAGQELRYKLKILYHFLGRETIATPAGEFQCLHYRYSSHYTGDIPETLLMEIGGDWWFAKDVGLVKQTGSETVLELTSYQN